MQDIHSIGSGGGGCGGGRLFGGNGGGDRRLRPHQNLHNNGPQALKCPRCESLNTKFCYYNNYNLSQPRHFCKSCRRYWTKGGVLRNVPVGGGCRKTKRSKSKSSNSHLHHASGVRKSSNSQNSSSDSSSLTGNTTAATTTVTTETKVTTTATATAAASGTGTGTDSAPPLLNFEQIQNPNPNPSFDPPLPVVPDHLSSAMFPEICSFTSLINSSSSQLPLGFNVSPFRLHHSGQIGENSTGDQQQWLQSDLMNDPTAQIEYSGMQNKVSNGGIDTEDWNNGADQALFDLTGTVDQSYWNQTQWDDHRSWS